MSLPCRKFEQVMKHTQVPMYHRHKQSNESRARMNCCSPRGLKKSLQLTTSKHCARRYQVQMLTALDFPGKENIKDTDQELNLWSVWFVSALGNRSAAYLLLPSRGVRRYLALFANSAGHATKQVVHGKPCIHYSHTGSVQAA